jgi:hypothetical protein
MVLAAFDRKSVLLGIPFAAMLAPISGTQPFGVEGLLLSDAFLAMACFAFLAGLINPNFTIRVGNNVKYFSLGFGLCLASWAASVDPTIAVKGVLNILALGMLYIVTASLVTSEKLGTLVIWSWVVAACYGAILTVVAYTQATPLLLGAETMGGRAYALDIISSQNLYRATFFYGGFFFVIGTAGIVFLVYALRGNGKLLRLAAIFGLGFALSVLFLMNTKSAMAGFIVLAIIEGWRSFSVGGVPARISRIVLLAVAIVVASLGAVYASLMLFGEDQWQIALARINDMESFEVRLQLYEVAMEHLLSSPKMFLVGLGPDLTVRMANSGYAEIESLLINPLTGEVGLSMDGGYLTVLVEYGVPFGVVMFVFAIKTIVMLYGAVRTTHDADLLRNSLLAIILWWMVVALGQTVGTSKPTWLIVQIIAIAHGVYSTHKKSSGIASMRQACPQPFLHASSSIEPSMH